jgi:hypothetical protein
LSVFLWVLEETTGRSAFQTHILHGQSRSGEDLAKAAGIATWVVERGRKIPLALAIGAVTASPMSMLRVAKCADRTDAAAARVPASDTAPPRSSGSLNAFPRDGLATMTAPELQHDLDTEADVAAAIAKGWLD